MPIIKNVYMDELESKDEPLWFHKRGLSFTRTGYGRKIPTTKMVRLPGNPRWRRVYLCIYSNIGTRYIIANKGEDWIVIN